MGASPEKKSCYLKAYGVWAGKPKGTEPDYNRCAERVYANGRFYSQQCSRPCGHGKGDAYCKQHAKAHPNE